MVRGVVVTFSIAFQSKRYVSHSQSIFTSIHVMCINCCTTLYDMLPFLFKKSKTKVASWYPYSQTKYQSFTGE
jgi:uncharacterized protein (UPF0276 family)